jgi:hypothetical protein
LKGIYGTSLIFAFILPNFPIPPIGYAPKLILAALTASAFLGAFPPIDFLAVYLVLAPPLRPLVFGTSSRSFSSNPASSSSSLSSSFSSSSSSFSSSSLSS